ncbi:MAG: SAM-dependent methyltransferase [Patescibacteria group bacterium]|nr:SAM-dependent methyltransferase [Patescibacteria group bacterium]MCL6096502.1 SAM-dependent methyltransferase [Patescibacteria group bacterium]
MLYGNEILRDFYLGKTTEEDLRRREKQVRNTAQEYARANTIEEYQAATLIKDGAYSYSEFQELGLYTPQGFFEETIDFSPASMPLMPQTLSPFFGKCISELAMMLYLDDPNRATDVTFMGIGAGKGFLDHDLIDHLMTVEINPEWEGEVNRLRRTSEFLVTDRTDRSQTLLEEELTEVRQTHQLGDRLKIMRVDATGFELERKPYGIVYGNEILDNMPVEPIIKIDEALCGIVVAPYAEGMQIADEESDYKRALGERFPELKGRTLSKDEARRLIEAGAMGLIKFKPVLIPLQSLPDLGEKVENSSAAQSNLENPDYESLYPLQAGLTPMLRSIRKSFSHGTIILIDYYPVHGNTHNWNQAVSSVLNFSLKDPRDLDFQIDFDQVKEEASREGMEVKYFSPQNETLRIFSSLLNTLTLKDMQRWANANGHGNLTSAQLPTAIKNGYSIFLPFSNFHNIICLSF